MRRDRDCILISKKKERETKTHNILRIIHIEGKREETEHRDARLKGKQRRGCQSRDN